VQIARGLAAAHERGIVHRDLKPENVFLTRDGQVKILDFGLARLATVESDGGETFSPTPSLPTRPGIVMGTPGYMSPEQVRGQGTDPRSDLFAFGTILYEMLAGRRAFRGDTAAEAMTAALREEPPELPASVPPTLDRLVRHCLEKDREQRFQSARDLAFDLEAILDRSTSAASAVPARRHRAVPAWVAWAAVTLVSTGVVGWLASSRAAPPGAPARFSITLPAGLRLADPPLGVAVSPDGRFIAFTATQGDNAPQLWVRPLDTLEPRLLAGTEDATLPFWSPDSRFLGFFAAGKLKRVAVEGSAPPQIVCDAIDSRGGTWNQTGDILFAPFHQSALYKVPAAGGEPVQVTHLEKTELSHRLPTFLPDGRRFLYVSWPGRAGRVETLVASLDDPRPKPLLRASSVATFAPGGYVLFTRDQIVLAQRLDPGSARLLGEPQPIGELPVVSFSRLGAPVLTGASTGLLAFGSELRWMSRLQWFDRAGVPGATVPIPAGYQLAGLSPDGRYAALSLPTSYIDADLWLLDLASGIITRLTHEPGQELYAVWSPDSRRFAYSSDRSNPAELYVREMANLEREERLGSQVFNTNPASWSRDGRFLFFDLQTAQSGSDLWYLPLDGARRAVPYLRTPFNESSGMLSPDGHWLAYASDESGASELYVQSFPVSGQKVRVSAHPSTWALWSADGRQLFFSGPDLAMMEVDVQTAPELRVSRPRLLFHLPPTMVNWEGTTDGRFLVQVKDAGTPPPTISVIVNWTALLEPDRR
jgi:Tol biopolymer transport system component